MFLLQDQYIFLHEAVLDGIMAGNTAIRCTDYISFYNEACQLNGYSDDSTSSLVQQFKVTVYIHFTVSIKYYTQVASSNANSGAQISADLHISRSAV